MRIKYVGIESPTPATLVVAPYHYCEKLKGQWWLEQVEPPSRQERQGFVGWGRTVR